MLDLFEVITTGGVVLWSRKYAQINSSIINNLISEVMIEDRPNSGTEENVYRKDHYTLKWTVANELGLIFVAVYQSLLQLTWIDDLLVSVKTLFISLYGDDLRKPNTATLVCPFDDYFDSRVRELERKSGGTSIQLKSSDLSDDALPLQINDMDLSTTSSNFSENHRGITQNLNSKIPQQLVRPQIYLGVPKGTVSRRNRRAGIASKSTPPASSGDEAGSRATMNKKKMRRWDSEGNADDVDDGLVLDYSNQVTTSPSVGVEENINTALSVHPDEMGSRNKHGDFLLRGIDDTVHSILEMNTIPSHATQSTGLLANAFGGALNALKGVVGSKILEDKDLDKHMKGMEDHLMGKNVAQEAVAVLCSSVRKSLFGKTVSSFQSLNAIVAPAMEEALRKMLTPSTPLDLLREINSIRAATNRPYVISIVGVNGVGKSTNLSKICFFLLQNKLKVLIAACDTFRSGAVEQLRVHARNLKQLSDREGGFVDLYEKGYGKDAANIAKDAVAYGAKEGFDVVLIDTAGRRHNDQRLMSSLEKFAKLANPDKILMVGEALVGSDSVEQARHFNDAFGSSRHLDGFIISKCDTVDDKIGTLVSMVFATGIPVVFLGTGQHYQDLRVLSIPWAVDLLMK